MSTQKIPPPEILSTIDHYKPTTVGFEQALKYAHKSCLRFCQPQVSSAHLILGLLSLHNSMAGDLLRQSGLSLQSIEGYISSRCTSPEEITIQYGVPLGRSALLAIDRAATEARYLSNSFQRHVYLGGDLLLFSILAEENGEAIDLFAFFHIDREKIRIDITEAVFGDNIGI